MIALLIGGWFLGVDPLLAAARDAASQAETVEAQNASIESIVERLTEEKAELPRLEAELGALQRSIPVRSDTSSFIESLNALASAAGVVVSGITTSDALPYAAPIPEVAPTPSEESEEAVAEPDDPLAPTALTDPLITPENFILVPVTVEAKGSADAVLNFVSGMQDGERLFLITKYESSVGVGADEEDTVTSTSTGFIYALLGQYELLK